MNIFQEIKADLAKIANNLFSINNNSIAVELPKDASHGDLSTNIALVLKQQLGLNPKEIADKIAVEINSLPYIESVTIAGPGFINFMLKPSFWVTCLQRILNTAASYGESNLGNNQKVNVEYVSANPTGPMHVGHMRQAAFGDALANLLSKAGFDVHREFYVNDAGGQINVVALTVYERYKQALSLPWQIGEGMYPGDYLIPIGQELANKYGNTLLSMADSERLDLLKAFSVEKMLELIKRDLKSFGVKHDVFFSEKALHDQRLIDQSLSYLTTKGLLYRGVLEPPKGKTPDDYEPREQTLFKATDFGDDVDRPIVKSDGSYTYFAADIAYHKNKLDRGFNDMVLVLGADHSGYIKRMKAVVAALSDHQAQIDIKIVQLVNLIKNGEPVKMSKRAGSYVTLEDVIDEVGKDVARFVMLTRKHDSSIDFDYDKVKEQSKENPVFYVHYANARINSVMKLASEKNLKASQDHLHLLNSHLDTQLIKLLCEYPKVIESAALTHEPHRITYYVIELATMLHSFWSYGNTNIDYRFIIESDENLTSARLSLALAVQNVIKSALSILGVEALEKM